MNDNTPYEQSIAAKLDQIPVPDMADHIWSDIEMQLDAAGKVPDMPAQKPATVFKRIGWYGLAGVVALVVVLWWYFSHKGPREAMPPGVLPETHAPASAPPSVSPPASPPVSPLVYDSLVSSPVSTQPAQQQKIPTPPPGIKKDTALFHAAPLDSLRLDSTINKPSLPDVDLYTQPMSPPSPLSPLPPPRSKKPRGVKGIGEDDYKITATKDSAKKKDYHQ